MATVKQLRQSKGITQEELAHSIVMSPTVISRMENGHHVSKTSVKRVAMFFGVSPTDIEGIGAIVRTGK